MGIIDIHTHLGDILFADGHQLIEQKNVTKAGVYDVLDVLEARYWETMPFHLKVGRRLSHKLIPQLIIRSGLKRNAIATRENLTREMQRFGVDFCGVLAVYPHVRFEHLQAAYEHDERLLPLTGADFDNLDGIEAKFSADIQNGARGLKLHPILQQVSLNDPRTFQVVEAFAPHGFPILFHAGFAEYFLKPENQKRESPEFGKVDDALKLVKAFPQVKFIIGHTALDEYKDAIDLFGDLPNAYVDSSFHTVAEVKEIIAGFSAERVLYGSDWPWGGMQTAIHTTKAACGGDAGLERAVFWENSAELLKL